MSDDAPPSLLANEPWPPRAGMRFFLLWIAAVLALAVIGRAINYLGPTWAPSDRGLQVIWLMTTLAGAGWQAWLLFPSGLRSFAWVGIALFITLAQICLLSSGLYGWVEAGRLLVLPQVALLIGVRHRPWLLAPATLLEWILASGGLWILNAFGHPWVERVAAELPAGIGIDDVFSSFDYGLWLLGNCATAAALAWLMPPCASLD